MEFQHDKSWECLCTIFASKLNAKDAWNKFIDFHELAVSKPYWTSLRHLNIEEEQKDITQWIHMIVTKTPILKDIVALWIGIIKYANKDKEIPAIYLVGSDTYDKDDIDWACDPIYLPKDRYAQLGILQQIDDIVREDEEDYEFLDWILPLAYCTFTFDEVIRTKLDKRIFLKNIDKLYIAVGHDSGDYMDLTTIE